MAEFTCALSSVRHPPTFVQTSLRHAPRSLQWNPLRRNQEFVQARAASEMIEAAQAVPHTDLTWQIAAGAIAGVAPFVVAGIEFSKRIIAQRRCNVCGGSGLVQRGEYYFRCGGCGGFLPWQSWRRFFSGRCKDTVIFKFQDLEQVNQSCGNEGSWHITSTQECKQNIVPCTSCQLKI